MSEHILISIKGIFTHKMRSFLTMLGIIIGIASIIAIVSTIKGTDEQIKKNLIGSGVNNVVISINQGDMPYEFYEGIPKGFKPLTKSTKDELLTIDHVSDVSFFTQRQEYETIRRTTNKLSGKMLGIDSSYLSTAGLQVIAGRTFLENDIKQNRHVVLLDKISVNQLFQNEDPIGKTIEIKGHPFIVVGVVSEIKEFTPTINNMNDYYLYQSSKLGRVFIPYEVWPLLYQFDEPQHVLIQTNATSSMTSVGQAAEKLLNAKVNNESIKYVAQDLLKQAQQIQQLSQSTNMMLIWIAGISLLVGGIGVMNIMLVNVTERTTEIGLKKAIGANRKSILTQFLTEAVVLTSFGGIIGVIVGIGLSFAVSSINQSPMVISVEASIFAVAFSMLIGIIFGLLPSYKAANLDPIIALRRE